MAIDRWLVAAVGHLLPAGSAGQPSPAALSPRALALLAGHDGEEGTGVSAKAVPSEFAAFAGVEEFTVLGDAGGKVKPSGFVEVLDLLLEFVVGFHLILEEIGHGAAVRFDGLLGFPAGPAVPGGELAIFSLIHCLRASLRHGSVMSAWKVWTSLGPLRALAAFLGTASLRFA